MRGTQCNIHLATPERHPPSPAVRRVRLQTRKASLAINTTTVEDGLSVTGNTPEDKLLRAACKTQQSVGDEDLRLWILCHRRRMEFVRLNIAMGVTDLPEYRDYWSEDPILHDTPVSSSMARRPNEKLGQYFHCSVAGEELAGDKLAKVRPLIDVCNRNYSRPCDWGKWKIDYGVVDQYRRDAAHKIRKRERLHEYIQFSRKVQQLQTELQSKQIMLDESNLSVRKLQRSRRRFKNILKKLQTTETIVDKMSTIKSGYKVRSRNFVKSLTW